MNEILNPLDTLKKLPIPKFSPKNLKPLDVKTDLFGNVKANIWDNESITKNVGPTAKPSAELAKPKDLGIGGKAKDALNLFGSNIGLGGIGGIVSAGTGLLDASGIENKTQRKMAMADAGVDTVAAGLSFIPGFGQAAGTALKLVNGIGGKFIKTPEDAKNFAINDDVARTGAFGGINDLASSTLSNVGAYQGSGLAGKLFGKKDLMRGVDKANAQQALGQSVVSESRTALDQAASSSAMFATRTNMNQQGSNAYHNIRFGRKGGKLSKFLFEVNKLKEGGNVTMVQSLKRYATDDERATWSRFKNFVASKNPKSADVMVIEPSQELWDEFNSYIGSNHDYATLANIMLDTKDAYNTTALKQLKDSPNDLKSKLSKGISWDKILKEKTSKVAEKMKANEKAHQIANPIPKPIEEPKSESDSPVKEGGDKSKSEKKEIFKKGGKLKQNVIVEGALHAHRHTVKDNDEYKDADITVKGVPVISKSEGGEIVQHAEVERDEIILHLELTKKLEALYKEGTEEAKIKAGKLLVKELLHNTTDSTSNLLED